MVSGAVRVARHIVGVSSATVCGAVQAYGTGAHGLLGVAYSTSHHHFITLYSPTQPCSAPHCTAPKTLSHCAAQPTTTLSHTKHPMPSAHCATLYSATPAYAVPPSTVQFTPTLRHTLPGAGGGGGAFGACEAWNGEIRCGKNLAILHGQIWYKMPRLWHNRHTLCMVVVISYGPGWVVGGLLLSWRLLVAVIVPAEQNVRVKGECASRERQQ